MPNDDLNLDAGLESPQDRVRRIGRRVKVPDDITKDYLSTTKVESGHNVNVRDSPKGAKGFGQVMPDVKGGTTRTVGGRRYNLRDPEENIEAGLRYFAEGGNDPVRRRLYYFGGPRAAKTYDRTGRIPNISDGNMTASQYVRATGGQQKPRVDLNAGLEKPEFDLSAGLVDETPEATPQSRANAKPRTLSFDEQIAAAQGGIGGRPARRTARRIPAQQPDPVEMARQVGGAPIGAALGQRNQLRDEIRRGIVASNQQAGINQTPEQLEWEVNQLAERQGARNQEQQQLEAQRPQIEAIKTKLRGFAEPGARQRVAEGVFSIPANAGVRAGNLIQAVTGGKRGGDLTLQMRLAQQALAELEHEDPDKGWGALAQRVLPQAAGEFAQMYLPSRLPVVGPAAGRAALPTLGALSEADKGLGAAAEGALMGELYHRGFQKLGKVKSPTTRFAAATAVPASVGIAQGEDPAKAILESTAFGALALPGGKPKAPRVRVPTERMAETPPSELRRQDATKVPESIRGVSEPTGGTESVSKPAETVGVAEPRLSQLLTQPERPEPIGANVPRVEDVANIPATQAIEPRSELRRANETQTQPNVETQLEGAKPLEPQARSGMAESSEGNRVVSELVSEPAPRTRSEVAQSQNRRARNTQSGTKGQFKEGFKESAAPPPVQPETPSVAPKDLVQPVKPDTPPAELAPPPQPSAPSVRETPASPKREPSQTSAKHAATAVEREELGLPEFERQRGRSGEKVLADAKAANAKDPRGVDTLIDQAIAGQKNYTDVETMRVNLRAREINNRVNELNKEIVEATDPQVITEKRIEQDGLIAQQLRTIEAREQAGTEWGKAGVARQRAIDQDFDLVPMIARMKKAKGRDLNTEERAKIDQQYNRIKELETKLSEAEDRAKSVNLQREIDKIARRGRRAETRATLDAEFDSLKATFAQIKATQGIGALFKSERGAFDPQAVKVIGEMARNRVKAGTVTAEGLVDEIHSFIKEHVPEVTKRDVRDAISGYGIEHRDRRGELAKQIARLKSELQSLSKSEDVEAGVRPAGRPQGPKLSEGQGRRAGPTTGEGVGKREGPSLGTTQGPRLSDARRLPAEGPKLSEGVGKQVGPQLSERQGPRLAEGIGRKEGPQLGPRQGPTLREGAGPTEGPSLGPKVGPEKRLFSRDAQRRRQIEHQIAELERRMRVGDYSDVPKREPPRYTKETYAIQKRLDEVKQQYSKELYRATRSTGGKISDELAKAANVPKTLKSIGDVSAVLRQGGFYSLTHPIEGLVKPTKEMLRSFTDMGWRNVEAKIKSDADFETLRKAGVEFTGVDKTDPRLSKHEEGYLGQEYLQYVPVAKQVANFSERTFVSFLDAQRLYIGKQMLRGLTAEQRKNPAELKAIAGLINAGTGRGNLGARGNKLAPALNVLMFSPRLVASRVQLLNNMISPRKLAIMPPGARKAMIKDNMKFLGAMSAMIGLAKASGATVSLDPDDGEFLKIRFGDTVYDQLTGLQQPLRFIINMARAASPINSRRFQAGPEMYTGKSMKQQIDPFEPGSFTRSKVNPALAPAINFATDSDFMGRKFSAKREVKELLVPLPANDIIEAMQQEGLIGAVKASPTFVGVGVGSYPPSPDKPTTLGEKLTRKLLRAQLPDKAREEDEIERDRKLSQLRMRARQGENVTKELDAFKGKITEQKRKKILGARGVTRLQEDFKTLSLRDALKVYVTYTPAERKSVGDLMATKAKAVDTMPLDEQADAKQKLKDFGFAPGMARPERPERPERPKRPDRSAWQAPN